MTVLRIFCEKSGSNPFNPNPWLKNHLMLFLLVSANFWGVHIFSNELEKRMQIHGFSNLSKKMRLVLCHFLRFLILQVQGHDFRERPHALKRRWTKNWLRDFHSRKETKLEKDFSFLAILFLFTFKQIHHHMFRGTVWAYCRIWTCDQIDAARHIYEIKSFYSKKLIILCLKFSKLFYF